MIKIRASDLCLASEEKRIDDSDEIGSRFPTHFPARSVSLKERRIARSANGLQCPQLGTASRRESPPGRHCTTRERVTDAPVKNEPGSVYRAASLSAHTDRSRVALLLLRAAITQPTNNIYRAPRYAQARIVPRETAPEEASRDRVERRTRARPNKASRQDMSASEAPGLRDVVSISES